MTNGLNVTGIGKKNYKNSIQGRSHVITTRLIRYWPALAATHGQPLCIFLLFLVRLITLHLMSKVALGLVFFHKLLPDFPAFSVMRLICPTSYRKNVFALFQWQAVIRPSLFRPNAR